MEWSDACNNAELEGLPSFAHALRKLGENCEARKGGPRPLRPWGPARDSEMIERSNGVILRLFGETVARYPVSDDGHT